MQLRPSRVLARLRQGEIASCTKLNSLDPRIAEIAALSGVDSIWVCVEHTCSSLETVENQIRAAKVHDVDTVVRVARGSYSDLIRPLEADAAGIIVPHLMSAEEARQIVYWTRFAPLGRRPLDGGNADGAYCQIAGEDYIRQANEERLVIVQIEDPEPLEELDEIASVEGIDMLFFGPGDYSHAIGVSYQLHHPAVDEARQKVAAVARKHGKYAGTVANGEDLRELVEMGYQFLSVSADVIILAAGFAEVAEAFNQLRQLRTSPVADRR
jgi:4-hydroxy-2-oxoheptanedioate aldolase